MHHNSPRIHIRKSLGLLLCLVWLVSAEAADNLLEPSARASFLDFCLPVPLGPSWYPEDSPVYRGDTLEEGVAVVTVDSLGCVIAVVPHEPADSLVVAKARPLITATSFIPARRGNRNDSGLILVILRQFPKSPRPVHYYPVDSSGVVIDPALYERSLELNGYKVPRVEMFPSIFCDLRPSDSVTNPPVVIMRMSLDSAGSVKRIDKYFSTYPTFELQVLSAALWAKYSPAKKDGLAVPGEMFVAVSFMPTVSYPTRRWTDSGDDSTNLYQRFIVATSTEAGSPVRLPLARALNGQKYISPVDVPIYYSELTALIAIDTLGGATLVRATPTDPAVQRFVGQMLARMQFYPAVQPDGRPVPFTGLLRIIPMGGREVQLTQTWLP